MKNLLAKLRAEIRTAPGASPTLCCEPKNDASWHWLAHCYISLKEHACKAQDKPSKAEQVACSALLVDLGGTDKPSKAEQVACSALLVDLGGTDKPSKAEQRGCSALLVDLGEADKPSKAEQTVCSASLVLALWLM